MITDFGMRQNYFRDTEFYQYSNYIFMKFSNSSDIYIPDLQLKKN